MILRYAIMALPYWLLMLGLLGLGACKKEDQGYQISGTVKRGNLGSVLGHVEVAIQHQPIVNGVFNSEYSTLSGTHTGSDGQFALSIPTATYASLRLVFSKDGYHQRIVDLNPAAFDQSSTLSKNATLYTQSTITLHVSDGATNYNQLIMRYKDVDFACVCCDNNWKYFDQPNIDTTLSCMVYGDQLVYYQYRLINTQLDTLITDSLFCTAFQNQNIELTY